MYKVLLIDDEKIIIKGLKSIINWEGLNCEVFGEACDGKEGIKKAKQLKPDIIIVDIKMPMIDGLQMIEQLMAEGFESKYIILSGYSEFEYAKKGIEMGVDAYLLKPVEELELEQKVQMLTGKIEEEKQSKAQSSELLKLKQTNKNISKNYILRDIVDSGIDHEPDIDRQLKSIGIDIFNISLVGMIIESDELGLYLQKQRDNIYKQIESVLPVGLKAVLFRYRANQIGVILNSKTKFSDDIIRDAGNKIFKTLTSNYDIKITIGVGSIVNNVMELSKTFWDARYVVGYKIIKGNTVILANDIKAYSTSLIKVPKEILDGISMAVIESDMQTAVLQINNFYDHLLKCEGLSLFQLQIQSLHVIVHIIQKIDSIQIELNKYFGKDMITLESISRFDSMEELKNWMTNILKSIIEIRSKRVVVSGSIIKQVIEYINDNYNKNITLALLSEIFYLSPQYISQLFKKKKGISYQGYVTQVRMEKAKELLLLTDSKIYEVSQKVGYHNIKHFRKTFERYAGVNPSEYKNRKLFHP